MNVFRLAGDMTFFVSMWYLFIKTFETNRCVGISLKTQDLYFVAFVVRCLHKRILDMRIPLDCDKVKKIVFLVTSHHIVARMRSPEFVTNDEDSFIDHNILVLACFMLARCTHWEFDINEFLRIFSLWLEEVAILPQLVLLQRSRNIDNFPGTYICFLGASRVLYICNWVYRFFTEEDYEYRWKLCRAVVVSAPLCAAFVYLYRLVLPLYQFKRYGEVKMLLLNTILGADR